jgi:two-component system, cell cycle sensor histidine kinase and response regulator CckA
MPKLLIIDDQKDNLISIKALLKVYMPECIVYTSESGSEGIALANRNFPDVILLDIIMPVMDGYEVCRVLNQSDVTKHIPIIMLTAIKTDSESRSMGLNAGADAFLSKPVEPNELVAQINVMLRLKRVEDKLRSENEDLELIVRERTQELWESKEYYLTIFENTGAATIIYQNDNTIISANKMFFELSGYTKKEIIGKKQWTDFVKDESRREIQYMGSKGDWDSSGGFQQFEVKFIDKTNRTKDILVSIKKIPGTNNIVASFLDVTTVRQIEKELRKIQKLDSIGTLASGIAHDFNNILMGIFGNIAMAMLNLEEDDPSLAFLKDAEKSIERARRLTGQLLTFSKGGNPIKESVHLFDFVQDVINFDLAGSKVKTVFEQDDDLWVVRADRGQLEQVFSNFAINALEAMPEGGTFTVRLENVEISDKAIPALKQGKYIKATIHDTGKGIPEKNLDQVFDPYFTTKQTGNGLGLSTVYSIIQKHNGFIQIESKENDGTIITIFLPAIIDRKRQETIETEKGITKQKNEQNILVMDDEKAVRDIISLLLGRVGYIVETVEEGSQALVRYQERMEQGTPFSLVIMDLTIPGGMGGKEAIKNLLELDPDAVVVVSSGYAEDPIMSNYAEFGFKGVIAKPYTLKKLLDKLDKILSE